MPLVHKKNTDFAGIHRCAVAPEAGRLRGPGRDGERQSGARLPYLFATCRFAHYLKCIVRDKVGAFKNAEDMQQWLQGWIMQYVDGDPAHSSEETKARRPLAAAEVTVEEDPSNPGYYSRTSSCGRTISWKG